MSSHLMRGSKRRRQRSFRRSEEGAVFAETIIIVPVILLFLVGVLEFGGLLWNKLRIENGVKDAARYLARCGHDDAFCDARARSIALCGRPVAACSSTRSEEFTADKILITRQSRGTDPVVNVINVRTTFDYSGAKLLSGMFGIDLLLSARHEERDIGQ